MTWQRPRTRDDNRRYDEISRKAAGNGRLDPRDFRNAVDYLAWRDHALEGSPGAPSGLAGAAFDYAQDSIYDDVARLQGRPPAAPRSRTPGPGRPAAPATNRRKPLKLARDLVIAVDLAVVVYVEKVLMTPHAVHGHLTRTAPKELVIVGLIFALPAILAVVASRLRSRSTPAPAAPSRPAFTRIGGPR